MRGCFLFLFLFLVAVYYSNTFFEVLCKGESQRSYNGDYFIFIFESNISLILIVSKYRIDIRDIIRFKQANLTLNAET